MPPAPRRSCTTAGDALHVGAEGRGVGGVLIGGQLALVVLEQVGKRALATWVRGGRATAGVDAGSRQQLGPRDRRPSPAERGDVGLG